MRDEFPNMEVSKKSSTWYFLTRHRVCLGLIAFIKDPDTDANALQRQLAHLRLLDALSW